MDIFNKHAFFVGRIEEIMRLYKKKILTNVKALERIENAINELNLNTKEFSKGEKE